MCVPAQYSLLRHLCWGLLLNHDPSSTWIAVMADYALYMDDSGHPDDQPYVAVAGFIATETEWLEFEPAWKAALKRDGLTEPFHMTDFMAEGRPPKERDLILRRLSHVIASNTRACFTGVIEVAAYRRVNEIYALQECLGAPYAVAARLLAIEMNKWTHRNLKSDDHLLLFAESGTKHRGDMIEVFKRDELPEPVSVPKLHPSVQPADMLAWEMFFYARGGENRKRVQKLLKGQTAFGLVFREKELVETCRRGNPTVPLRSGLPDNVKIVFHSSPRRRRVRTIH